MTARLEAVARGMRRRHPAPLPAELRAALAAPARDRAVETELALLPPQTRAELEAGFAAEARALARRLGATVAAGDGEAARSLAHALAGCAAAFGRPRIAALARLAAQSAVLREHATARAALAALAAALPAGTGPEAPPHA